MSRPPPPVSRRRRLPMGARFQPRDEEKINYLYNKVKGEDLPCCDDFIGNDDLYGDKEPWEIFGDSKEGEMYFFTALKKIGKKATAKRFSRNVGRGTWTNKGQKVPIFGTNGQCIGYKRSFRYERRNNNNNNNKRDEDEEGTWLLKEYTLPDNVVGRVEEKYRDKVLCELKRKGWGRRILGPDGSHDYVDDYFQGGVETTKRTKRIDDCDVDYDQGGTDTKRIDERIDFDLNLSL